MIKSNNEWAEKQSGHAKLGDPRRTSRLVKIASDLALYPGKSVVKSSPSPASMEGAYRFIRNENVSSDDIAEAGFNATVNQGHHYLLLLAIEDTTSMISEIGSGHSSKMTDSLPHGVDRLSSKTVQEARAASVLYRKMVIANLRVLLILWRSSSSSMWC